MRCKNVEKKKLLGLPLQVIGNCFETTSRTLKIAMVNSWVQSNKKSNLNLSLTLFDADIQRNMFKI